MQSIINGMEGETKLRTAENYKSALNSFTQYLRGRDFAPSELSADMLAGFAAWLCQRKISRNTVSLYMRILRAVYNRAVFAGLTADRHCFHHVFTGVEKTVKRAIDADCIKRISLLRLPCGSQMELARDVFMLSFYMRGMSFIDMAFLRKTDLSGGFITYHRRKTGQRLCIRWEQCMSDIVERHPAKDGSPYLLPLIDPDGGDEYTQYRNMQKRINRHLKVIGERAGLPLPLTMYVSRHSWASIAKSRGVPIEVISECLGHESTAITRIYLATLDTSRIDNANLTVIEGLWK